MAGLSKLDYFKKFHHNEIFVTKLPKKVQVSQLFVQCLFEAQIKFDYTSTYNTSRVEARCTSNPLDRFPLGYCIAASRASWEVELLNGFIDSLVWGLISTESCEGEVTKMVLTRCSLSLGTLTKCPQQIIEKISHLRIIGCRHDFIEANPMPLPEAISSMLNIKRLELCHNQFDDEVASLFEQLGSSKVSCLCYNRNYCTNQPKQVFYTALKGLLQQLTRLQFGQHELSKQFDPKELCKMFFAHTSLQKLTVSLCEYSSVSLLETNTNLVNLTIKGNLRPHIESLVNVLRTNKTLRKMTLEVLENHDSLKKILDALQTNTTMQKLSVKVDKALHSSIHTIKAKVPRICWKF